MSRSDLTPTEALIVELMEEILALDHNPTPDWADYSSTDAGRDLLAAVQDKAEDRDPPGAGA